MFQENWINNLLVIANSVFVFFPPFSFVLAYFALLLLIGFTSILARNSLISSGPQCLSVDKDK